ncbi:hypothetical protein POREN0001_1624 [Porphyromonas endodontalis ATCC 35406]|uniref:Uncharacterized protein n=1 Tax=Porphyromonas endodontalis (strain ATCC 35406 / DSM 24491 / JCM 8526 / CCUG 16442 / BCRC 14492 / NCTC 13058 / HG 370) TaxID=553175 RepID=C3JCL0_POREA|nr:hypothetical protein POREN0001_1624 [Porphyromonas endodontalis ATCC 35406]
MALPPPLPSFSLIPFPFFPSPLKALRPTGKNEKDSARNRSG